MKGGRKTLVQRLPSRNFKTNNPPLPPFVNPSYPADLLLSSEPPRYVSSCQPGSPIPLFGRRIFFFLLFEASQARSDAMSFSASSGSSKAGTLGGYARKLSIITKPSMTIHIDNHYHSKVYTTSSEISGHITISPQSDVRFDALQIVLFGTSKTRIDTVNIPQATSHNFLKLTMPIPESSYPVPRIFEAGINYNVPFTFVIPSTLTLNACHHQVANDSVQEHHVRLPPTLGSWERDDFSPDMSRIQYTIKGRLYADEEAGAPHTKIMEASREIKVLPVVTEDAPLNITKYDDLYTMSKRKTLRRTILSPKSGKVSLTGTQPRAAMLSPDGQTITPTTVPLELEFIPAASDVIPPKVTGVSAKVTAVTYFSCNGINHYPNLQDGHPSFGPGGRGSYSGTTSVCVGPVDDAKWGRRLLAQARPDSGSGTEVISASDSDHSPISTSKASATKKGKTKTISPPFSYTARLQIPVQLPAQKKAFIPTFHSCISSRVYVLWVTVSLASGGATAHLTLGLPLQIGVSPSGVHDTGLPPSFEEAQAQELAEEADAYLGPRQLTGRPNVEPRRREQTPVLPGYADLMQSDHHRRIVAAH
ncbi:hypothetical protein GGS23DRAFT_550940 [Durotheca rogersii]|uniref:uncharacterized protein n=1 Tax=Durotheca rogersii TaxID=419775 RepID=UPI002220E66D|nr:uncharacterized protein GGS23DRAFT_550940 [Durotheca rogersii]KAI5866514.1 hypothetical protein GGS23DRAFT_550940 [Durotheca rogersii]